MVRRTFSVKIALLGEFMETDWGSQESLVAANSLLEELKNKPSFPTGLLAPIYCKRGEAYYQLKEYQQALTDFNRALELDPDYTWAYHSRGRVYDALKEYQQAIVDFNHMLEIDPNYTHGYCSRGWAYYWLKEYQQALADFNRALELHPDYAYAHYGRGWAYCRLKGYQQAMADFDHTLELNPNFARAYCGRGYVYRNLKEYQQAIVDFNYALELDPNDDWAYIHRGHIHLWLEDIKQAEADFTRSWKLAPSQIWSGWMMNWTSMCLDRPAPAIAEWLETIAATNPKFFAAYLCRGTAKYLSKCFEDAIVELEQAAQLEPDQGSSAYFWKGMAYISLERDEEATAAIEKALRLELPPILLAPLRWFEQEKPAIYKKYIMPLLFKYEH